MGGAMILPKFTLGAAGMQERPRPTAIRIGSLDRPIASIGVFSKIAQNRILGVIFLHF